MILKNDTRAILTAEQAGSVEHACYVFAFGYGSGEIARIAPESLRIKARFSDAQTDEIDAHLRSYTEKILLTEENGRLWGIMPSLFPSSTVCIALIFDGSLISGEDALRLAREERYRHLFLFSDSISLSPSRMSPRLETLRPRFEALLERLSACFLGMDALKDSDAESAERELRSRISALSLLVGCPVELECAEDLDCRETDLPLFVAFLLSMLCCARSEALSRRATLSLSSSSSAARLCVCLETERPLTLSPAIMEWESIGADKNMPFEYLSTDNGAMVTFQPLRRDWSYLGLKQRTKFIFE